MQLSELAYNRYGATLYRYALMIVADHGMAEDVIHLVFMKYIRSGRKIAELEALYLYLRKAVRNESYKQLQKKTANEQLKLNYSRRPLLESKSEDSAFEQQLIIEEAISKLPPPQREVLHMKVYENMTFREIAEIIDESINTVSSRYKYAINKLRNIMPGEAKDTLYG